MTQADDVTTGAPAGPWRFVLVGSLFEGGLAGVAWGLGWLLGVDPTARFRPTMRGFGLGLVATLPMLVLFGACLQARWSPLVRIRRFFDEVIRPLLGGAPLVGLALLATSAGVGEELLFRGALQDGLISRIGPGAALALASLIFGLLHAITPAYLVLATLMGAYLGATYLVSGNLTVPIVSHALYDVVALAYLLRGRPSGDSP